MLLLETPSSDDDDDDDGLGSTCSVAPTVLSLQSPSPGTDEFIVVVDATQTDLGLSTVAVWSNNCCFVVEIKSSSHQLDFSGSSSSATTISDFLDIIMTKRSRILDLQR